MDIEELTAALADRGHAPEPDAVMAALTRKRRRRARRRWSAAGGCLAAAAAAAVIAPAAARNPASPTASGTRPAISVSPDVRGGPGVSAAQRVPTGMTGIPAAACAPMSLAQRAAAAVRSGGSAVIADASPAGTGAVTLRDVRTLRGPTLAAAVTGHGVTGFTRGGLRGEVFAIVLPGGRVLAAPVSGGTVRFASAGCWGTADMPLTAAEHAVSGG